MDRPLGTIRRMNTNDLIQATIERLVFEQGGALPDDWPSDGAERSNDDDIPELAQFERESETIGQSDA